MVFRMPGMGDIKDIIKSPEQRGLFFYNSMWEDTEQFFGQRVFGNAVVVVEAGLSRPGYMEGGVDMSLGPLHNVAQLRPIVHIREIQIFYRRAGDDHTVIPFILDLVKGSIKGSEMAGIRILGNVASHLKELHLNLQRRIGQLAKQLRFSDDFGRH